MVVFERGTQWSIEEQLAVHTLFSFFFFSFLSWVNKKPRLLADSGVNVKARLLFSAYDSP